MCRGRHTWSFVCSVLSFRPSWSSPSTQMPFILSEGSVGVWVLDRCLCFASARSAGTRRSPGLSRVASPWRKFGKSRHSAKRWASAFRVNTGKWRVLMNSFGFLSLPGCSAERRGRRQRREQLRRQVTAAGNLHSWSNKLLVPVPLTPHILASSVFLSTDSSL